MNRPWIVLLMVAAWLVPAPGAWAQTAPGANRGYAAIVERPLFDPSRRPRVRPEPPPPVPVATAPVPEAPPFSATLLGVVTGKDRTIVVLRQSDGRVLRLAEGEVVEGWRIAAIHVRSIDLERDGKKQSLRLAEPGNGQP